MSRHRICALRVSQSRAESEGRGVGKGGGREKDVSTKGPSFAKSFNPLALSSWIR